MSYRGFYKNTPFLSAMPVDPNERTKIMEFEQTPLLAAAVLVPDPECYQWKVLSCPHCGRAHFHGAGLPHADHDRYLGHRVAHCATRASNNGYVLVKAASAPPPPPLAVRPLPTP